MKSQEEHKFTSTGIKFWQHRGAMQAYKDGDPNTVVSTHIAPEGACNLKCPYCSVTHRKVHNRIDLDTIFKYVDDLMGLGLKAVILTGGGEPTIYPHFNKLVRGLKSRGLSVALITNGTQSRRVDPDVWGMFSWIRFSINMFKGWDDSIKIPNHLTNDNCVIGSSFVFTQKHEKAESIDVDLLKRVAAVARRSDARYVRLLPNCLLPQKSLIGSHDLLEELLQFVDDKIFFHQHKLHGSPNCSKCHQSHFRPYLSEVPHGDTGIPGSVYPCDSVVLNNEYAEFVERYQLCAPGDVLKYMNGEIKQKFDAKEHCTGCVFTDTVNMLDRWMIEGEEQFDSLGEPTMHGEFV
jgi:organic radical activating enzyme